MVLWPAVFLFTLIALIPGTVKASQIYFEGLPDSTVLTNQYLGATFSNAVIETAGVSLDEFEFPPHSGLNVAFDSTGPMSILFDSPVTSISGYFTYAESITLAGFSDSGVEVATVSSAFLSNMGLSGVAGSSPNEFLSLSYAPGISSISITGDPNGGSFALDDFGFDSGAPPDTAPEPSTILLVGFVLMAAWASRFGNRHVRMQ